MSRIIALSFLPLIICVLLALGVHAQAGNADTASDDAPAAVQSNTAADPSDDSALGANTTTTPPTATGGAATTRAPGGALGGAVGTGTLAPADATAPAGPLPRTGLAPAGTNQMGPQMGTSGNWAPGTSTTGSQSTYSQGAWMPGFGMMPGNVGPNLAGSAQAPVAIPSGVAVGPDGRPARARNVGEGEGETAAQPANAGANAGANNTGANNAGANNAGANNAGANAIMMPVPAQVFIVAPGFTPSNASNASNATSNTTNGANASTGASTTNNTARANEERDATPVDVTSAELAAAPESYNDRKLTLRGRVTSVNGNSFKVTSSKADAATIVVAPAALSDSPLREDVIVTGTLENRDGQRVLVAESVIQIER